MAPIITQARTGECTHYVAGLGVAFRRLWLVMGGVAVAALTVRAQDSISTPMQRLSRIIGVWDVDDRYRSLAGVESRETGVRTCAWALANRYVECVTLGRSSVGRERVYRWMITWDASARRYTLMATFSNTGLIARQTIRIDSTGTVWHIRSAPWLDDEYEQWTGAELRFEGHDRAVWTAFRNLDTQPITHWEQSTRETWGRRPQR